MKVLISLAMSQIDEALLSLVPELVLNPGSLIPSNTDKWCGMSRNEHLTVGPPSFPSELKNSLTYCLHLACV